MRIRILRIAGMITVAFAGLLLAACSTTGSKGEASKVELYKGMPVQELITHYGEPEEIRPYEEDKVKEVFIYTYRNINTTVEAKSYEMEEIPFVDPFTGEEKMILQPVFTPETSILKEETQILVVESKVAAWKVYRKERVER